MTINHEIVSETLVTTVSVGADALRDVLGLAADAELASASVQPIQGRGYQLVLSFVQKAAK